MATEKVPTLDEVRKLIDERLTLSLWPEAGVALGLSRGQAYRLAADGKIKTLELGRAKRVATSWLKKQLGLAD